MNTTVTILNQILNLNSDIFFSKKCNDNYYFLFHAILILFIHLFFACSLHLYIRKSNSSKSSLSSEDCK